MGASDPITDRRPALCRTSTAPQSRLCAGDDTYLIPGNRRHHGDLQCCESYPVPTASLSACRSPDDALGDAQRWLAPTGDLRHVSRAAAEDALPRRDGGAEAVATGTGREWSAGTIRRSACQRRLLPRLG